MTTKPVKIKRAVVKNIKKIKFAEITPDKDVIIITGGNGQGKSSFTDGIFSVFGGKDSVPKIPLNTDTGKTKGSTEVELTNGLTLIREITTKGTTLKIIDEKGSSISSPQKYINDRLELFSFNPMEFADSDEKDRLKYAKKVLRMVVGKDIPDNIQEIMNKYDVLGRESDTVIDVIDSLVNNTAGVVYIERRDVNREIKILESSFQDGLKDYSDEIAQIDAMFAGDGSYYGEQHANLKDAFERAKIIKECIGDFSDAHGKLLKALPEVPKSPIMQEIMSWKANVLAGLEYMNKVVYHQGEKLKDDEKDILKTKEDLAGLKVKQESYDNNKENVDRLEKLRKNQDIINNEMELLRSTKEQILQKIKFPVENMILEEDDVYVNNLPFSQCSQSERLIISIKLAIALNPELRVMRILNGNLLDSKTFSALENIIKETDFQIWIEWVSSEYNGVGYFFENGEIKRRESK